ncbi:MAG: beta-galactosidase GalA [Gemmatimonadales bacterium]
MPPRPAPRSRRARPGPWRSRCQPVASGCCSTSAGASTWATRATPRRTSASSRTRSSPRPAGCSAPRARISTTATGSRWIFPDWAVELPFVQAEGLVDYGCKPLGRDYPATSIGWYRRVFDLPASDRGRRLSLEFDGVFRDATFSLNGQFLGRNQSGYAPSRYDITDVATCGGRNVLVVRVDATGHEGWFYEGAGIYRHVWLVKAHPVHAPQWGTFVTSDVRAGAATLTVRTAVANEDDVAHTVTVISEILDPAGRRVVLARAAPAALESWGTREVAQEIIVRGPELWSVDTPRLYRLVTTLAAGGVELDRTETPFGIRTIAFDPNRGFLLNGERVELKGTCNHQDHAGVGAALPDALQGFRVERLKSIGCNAIRTSHNAPTPELLDACDRLGMLVLDESRMFSAEPEGASQLERQIRRDRNHPSVFCWSIANEEWRVQGGERGRRIAANLHRLVRRLDPSRPVTAAMDSGYSSGEGITAELDVQGFNYQRDDLDAFHRRFPRLPAMGTETASSLATRGVYVTDAARGYVSAYDVNRPEWGATAETWWSFYAARPWLAGGFVWTGFDYRGEPTPYKWPCISSHFGLLDACGFPKDTAYYYQAWWTDRPVLHLFPHWTWPGKEGSGIEVWCHTNCERVELFLNGRSFGARDVPRNSHAAWTVPYEAGVLEARGMNAGQVVLTDRRETTGAPARLVLRADRPRIAADGEDAAQVEVSVVDAAGRVAPVADDEVTFVVTGSGRLIGVGNGDPSSHEADHATVRRAFNGLCAAIVQASRESGELRVAASAPGLEPAELVIVCEPKAPRPAVPT